jgi:hypothetical protein
MKIHVHQLAYPGSCKTKGRGSAKVVACAIVDNNQHNIAKLYWTLSPYGYALSHRHGKEVRMHRLVLGIPDKIKLDVVHLNRDRLDNRKRNLKAMSRSSTALLMNRKMRSDSTTGFRGITCIRRPRYSTPKRWRGQVYVGGRYFATKRCATCNEAIRALNKIRVGLGVETKPYCEVKRRKTTKSKTINRNVMP